LDVAMGFSGFAMINFHTPFIEWEDGNSQLRCGGDLLRTEIIQFDKCFSMPGNSLDPGGSWMLDKHDSVLASYYAYSGKDCVLENKILDRIIRYKECGVFDEFGGALYNLANTIEWVDTAMSLATGFSDPVYQYYPGVTKCTGNTIYVKVPATARCALDVEQVLKLGKGSPVRMNDRTYVNSTCSPGNGIVKKHYYNGGASPNAWRHAKNLPYLDFRAVRYGNPERCSGAHRSSETIGSACQDSPNGKDSRKYSSLGCRSV